MKGPCKFCRKVQEELLWCEACGIAVCKKCTDLTETICVACDSPICESCDSSVDEKNLSSCDECQRIVCLACLVPSEGFLHCLDCSRLYSLVQGLS